MATKVPAYLWRKKARLRQERAIRARAKERRETRPSLRACGRPAPDGGRRLTRERVAVGALHEDDAIERLVERGVLLVLAPGARRLGVHSSEQGSAASQLARNGHVAPGPRASRKCPRPPGCCTPGRFRSARGPGARRIPGIAPRAHRSHLRTPQSRTTRRTRRPRHSIELHSFPPRHPVAHDDVHRGRDSQPHRLASRAPLQGSRTGEGSC